VPASHFRLLDLFCGEGLAAWGYWRSGRFSDITGVDINPDVSTRYAFNFVCADALTLDYEFLSQFDFIHASPPCQAYSDATPKAYKDKHPRLIPDVKHMLHASGKPYVIENVPGSKSVLRPNVAMNGLFFGLESNRPRYFYASTLGVAQRLIKPGKGRAVHGNEYLSIEELIKVFGLKMIGDRRLNLLTRDGIKQGIPPVFTMALSCLLLPDKFRIA
jgi:DNA (cytosine-5)-methyltransferase 1